MSRNARRKRKRNQAARAGRKESRPPEKAEAQKAAVEGASKTAARMREVFGGGAKVKTLRLP